MQTFLNDQIYVLTHSTQISVNVRIAEPYNRKSV